MTRKEYFENVQRNFDNGAISAEAYDAALMNEDAFCYEDENEEEDKQA